MVHMQLNLFGEPEPVARSPIEILRERPAPDPRSPVVVSYGGGRNSTAMLILCHKLNIKVDLILFADTGGELSETYEFIEIFDKWLLDHGMPKITIVRRDPVNPTSGRRTWMQSKENLYFMLSHRCSEEILHLLLWWISITGAACETLEEYCLATQTLPSKAYGQSSCSLSWKIEPQEKYINSWEVAQFAWNSGVQVRKMIGIHFNEIQRLVDKKTKSLRSLSDTKYYYEYPLVQHGIGDIESQILIASEGLPIPSKSSCFFCPNRKISEIQELPEDLRLRGNLIEQVAQDGIHWNQDSFVKGLGRKFSWRSLNELTELEKIGLDFRQQSRNCGCMD